MAKLDSLYELLIDELKDLHSAETQLLKALPEMAEAASCNELRDGFTAHLEQTNDQVARLERALDLLGVPAKGKTCHAMKGLVEEGEEAIKAKGPDAVRDANLIGAAQRVEHYEIAAYGTARAFAEVLGLAEVVALLQATLFEETETNQKLTYISETVNVEAAALKAASG